MSDWRSAIGAVLLCCLAGPAVSADRAGQFAALGAGTTSCGKFLQERAAKSRAYYLYGGWVEGYLSARNQLDAETFSLVPWQSIDLLAGSLAEHCKADPKKPFLHAVAEMAAALQSQRLRQSSERVTLSVGPVRQSFFVATLARMQKRLGELSLYDGPAEGAFDEKTAAALRRFQQQQGIEVSGFPDQLTLFKLFF